MLLLVSEYDIDSQDLNEAFKKLYDTNFLNSVGGRYRELPHPFLSSVNLTKPILPDKLRNNDF